MSKATVQQQQAVYRIIIDALQSLGHTSEWVEEQVDELIGVVVDNVEEDDDA